MKDPVAVFGVILAVGFCICVYAHTHVQTAVVDPQPTGNSVVYHRATDGEVSMTYENHGKLCGVVDQYWETGYSGPKPNSWAAWALAENWKRHFFGDKQSAMRWLSSTWCKP
jgi:hypothetical protein